MTLSTTRRTAYRLFALLILLLMLAEGCALLASLAPLPDSPSLPYPLLTTLAETLFPLALLTGLIGVGLHLLADTYPNAPWLKARWPHGLYIGWLVLLLLMLALAVDGWHGLDDISASPLLLAFVYPLLVVGMGFWLMRRFSTIPAGWAAAGRRNVALLLTAAALTMLLPPLRLFGLIVIPLAYMIFAAHSYRAFTEHNGTPTLAAHWYALSLMLILLGNGIMGALFSIDALRDPALVDLQAWLLLWSVLAAVMGVVNQAGAELRGESRRITGLLPYWCVLFGTFGAGLGLFSLGLVEVYLGRLLAVDAAQMQAYSQPLYLLWMVGRLVQGAGILIYALGFWARRPLDVL